MEREVWPWGSPQRRERPHAPDLRTRPPCSHEWQRCQRCRDGWASRGGWSNSPGKRRDPGPFWAERSGSLLPHPPESSNHPSGKPCSSESNPEPPPAHASCPRAPRTSRSKGGRAWPPSPAPPRSSPEARFRPPVSALPPAALRPPVEACTSRSVSLPSPLTLPFSPYLSLPSLSLSLSLPTKAN